MKQWRKYFVGFSLIVGLAIFLWRGPRVEVDETIKDMDVPDDLDDFLEGQEAQFADIRPNTEKKIIWANPSQKSKTPFSIVYIHGFTATRQETAPLMDIVAQDLGANLFYTRLSGHGREGDALLDVTVNDWLNDTVEAFQIGQQIGERIIVVGTSTGATLATWLAGQPFADRIAAFVMLSPNLGLKDKRTEYFVYPWAKYFVPWMAGQKQVRHPETEEEKIYWTQEYPSVALIPMMGIVSHVRRFDFNKILAPLMMIYSPEDVVIDTDEMERIFNEWGTEHKMLLPIETTTHPSHHVIVGDIREPQNNRPIADQIIDFLTPILKPA